MEWIPLSRGLISNVLSYSWPSPSASLQASLGECPDTAVERREREVNLFSQWTGSFPARKMGWFRLYTPNLLFPIYQSDKSLHFPGRERKLAKEIRQITLAPSNWKEMSEVRKNHFFIILVTWLQSSIWYCDYSLFRLSLGFHILPCLGSHLWPFLLSILRGIHFFYLSSKIHWVKVNYLLAPYLVSRS